MSRNQEIIKTGEIGIAGNLLLSIAKFFIGTAANSVAITMDAANNITDALSSLLTIIGTKLSEREPDAKHPFGYGRVETLTTLFIGVMILYAGFTAVKQSVLRILEPEACSYSGWSLAVVAVAVVVKVVLGIYMKKQGTKLESAALVAAGADSINDSAATGATLLSALIYVGFKVNVEAFVGLAIAALIIKTGFETLRDTVSSILGERIDAELVSRVRRSISSFPEVNGVFDIVIHNYGKDKLIGSAHIEVPDALKASWVDNLQRSITRRVLKDTGVEMLGLTIYAENTRDPEANQIREDIREIISENESVLGAYGVYLDKVDKAINFVIVIDYDVHDKKALHDEIHAKLKERYPEYEIHIMVERSLAD